MIVLLSIDVGLFSCPRVFKLVAKGYKSVRNEGFVAMKTKPINNSQRQPRFSNSGRQCSREIMKYVIVDTYRIDEYFVSKKVIISKLYLYSINLCRLMYKSS